MVHYGREMTAKKYYKYGKYWSFEHLLLSFVWFSPFCSFSVPASCCDLGCKENDYETMFFISCIANDDFPQDAWNLTFFLFCTTLVIVCYVIFFRECCSSERCICVPCRITGQYNLIDFSFVFKDFAKTLEVLMNIIKALPCQPYDAPVVPKKLQRNIWP